MRSTPIQFNHSWLIRCTQRFLSTQVIYFANSAATKISLLLLYYRIFGVNQKLRLAMMVCGFFSISYFIACTFTALFGCHPVSYFWNKHQSGKCINQVKFFRGNGIVNLLIDVMILCLPMPLVWRLKIERRQKITLSALFLLGGLYVPFSYALSFLYR